MRFEIGNLRLAVLALVLGAAMGARAGDLTRGATLYDGQRVSASQLHQLVDSGSINTTFLTGKTLESSPTASHYMLLYSAGAGAYYKTTLGSAFLNNSAVITGQTEDTAPVTNSFFLTYSGSGLKKTAAMNLFGQWTALQPGWTNLTYQSAFWGEELLTLFKTNGAYCATSFTNLFGVTNLINWTALKVVTNLTAETGPTNYTLLLAYDPTNKVYKGLSLASLATNLPANLSLSNADTIVSYAGSRSNLATLPVGSLRTNLVQTYVATNAMPAAGGLTNFTHGLGGVPHTIRLSLICTNPDAATGYAAGDEIDMGQACSDAYRPFAQYTVTATTIALRRTSEVTLNLINKSTGASANATAPGNFTIKCTAVYFPAGN